MKGKGEGEGRSEGGCRGEFMRQRRMRERRRVAVLR